MSVCRPDRATAQRTQITIQEEECWGELAEDQNALGVEFANEGVANQLNFFNSNLLRGDRMRSKGQRGNDRPGGDLTGELQPNGIWPLILKHALGGDTAGAEVTTTGSNPYKHAMKGSLLLPEGLSLEKRFGYPSGNYNRLRYLGGKVNEFFFDVPTEGVITARAGLLFKSEEEVDEDMDATPSFPTDNEAFTSFHGTLLMDVEGNGTRVAIATLTAFNFLLNNGIDPEQFAIGARGRADLPEDERTINGNMSAFFTRDNWKLYQATKNNTTLSLDFKVIRGVYIMRFVIPALTVRFPTPTVQQKGPLNLTGPYEAHRDDVTGTDVQVEITNRDPVISTAA